MACRWRSPRRKRSAYYTTNIWNTSYGCCCSATPHDHSGVSGWSTFTQLVPPDVRHGRLRSAAASLVSVCPTSSVSSVLTRLGVCSRLRSRRITTSRPTIPLPTKPLAIPTPSSAGQDNSPFRSRTSRRAWVTASTSRAHTLWVLPVTCSRAWSRPTLRCTAAAATADIRASALLACPTRFSQNGLTQLELTTSYGIRGAYNHNWDPYWTSSIYGAWAAMSYNTNAKALICDRFAAARLPSLAVLALASPATRTSPSRRSDRGPLGPRSRT